MGVVRSNKGYSKNGIRGYKSVNVDKLQDELKEEESKREVEKMWKDEEIKQLEEIPQPIIEEVKESLTIPTINKQEIQEVTKQPTREEELEKRVEEMQRKRNNWNFIQRKKWMEIKIERLQKQLKILIEENENK